MLISQIRIRINAPTGHMPGAAGWQRSREHSLRLADQEIWLVCAGHGWMQTRTHRFDLHPGFCAWMRPGGMYDAGQDESSPLAITYIHFDATDTRGRSVPASALTGAREFGNVANPGYADAITRRVVELFNRAEKGARQFRAPAEALLKAFLMDLAADATSEKENMPLPAWRRNILAAAAHIRDNAGRLPPIRMLAEKAGMTPEHFSRAFRRVMGMSPQRYVVDSRIQMARHLLLESDFSISAIAGMLGYKDLYFFSRQFKQQTGTPPSTFRVRSMRPS